MSWPHHRLRTMIRSWAIIRNKAFDLYRGVTIEQKIMEAIGDRRLRGHRRHAAAGAFIISRNSISCHRHRLPALTLSRPRESARRFKTDRRLPALSESRADDSRRIPLSCVQSAKAPHHRRNFIGQYFIRFIIRHAIFTPFTTAAGLSLPVSTSNFPRAIPRPRSRVSSVLACLSRISTAPN